MSVGQMEIKGGMIMERVKYVVILLLVPVMSLSTFGATILHFDFEDGIPETPMNTTGMTGQIGTYDLSGNGYNMYAWDAWWGPSFSALRDTATGVGLSSDHPGHGDGYAWAEGLVGWQPSSWTVELSFRFDNPDGWRTLIGKDGFTNISGDPAAGLYIQSNGIDNRIRFNFATVSGERISLDSELIPEAGKWYHLVIVVDGDEIRMYADRLDGNSFQLIREQTMTAGLDHSLQATGTWTFGRGWFNGNQADQISGDMDDIRFSDAGLPMDKFLQTQYAYFPNPQQNSENTPSLQTTLSWRNQDWVDACKVYFGRNTGEPNAISYKTMLTLVETINAPEKDASVTIPEALEEGDVCYWVVDSWRGGLSEEPNMPGIIWRFEVNNNDEPVVYAGEDQAVWFGKDGADPNKVDVTLSGSASDDGLPADPGVLSILWSQVSGPAVNIDPANVEETAVTLVETGVYEFNLRATDGEFEGNDRVVIYVGEDPCDASHRMPGAPGYAIFDFDQDCVVDLRDLSMFAAGWLGCTDILTDCN